MAPRSASAVSACTPRWRTLHPLRGRGAWKIWPRIFRFLSWGKKIPTLFVGRKTGAPVGVGRFGGTPRRRLPPRTLSGRRGGGGRKRNLRPPRSQSLIFFPIRKNAHPCRRPYVGTPHPPLAAAGSTRTCCRQEHCRIRHASKLPRGRDQLFRARTKVAIVAESMYKLKSPTCSSYLLPVASLRQVHLS